MHQLPVEQYGAPQLRRVHDHIPGVRVTVTERSGKRAQVRHQAGFRCAQPLEDLQQTSSVSRRQQPRTRSDASFVGAQRKGAIHGLPVQLRRGIAVEAGAQLGEPARTGDEIRCRLGTGATPQILQEEMPALALALDTQHGGSPEPPARLGHETAAIEPDFVGVGGVDGLPDERVTVRSGRMTDHRHGGRRNPAGQRLVAHLDRPPLESDRLPRSNADMSTGHSSDVAGDSPPEPRDVGMWADSAFEQVEQCHGQSMVSVFGQPGRRELHLRGSARSRAPEQSTGAPAKPQEPASASAHGVTLSRRRLGMRDQHDNLRRIVSAPKNRY